ncbi:MAG TPA: SRPBCC domain-containing protein [Bryobacteraceae bacterium]|nr:SRPBCC domain-containing protein [Bryobacteraceae bacterium]
MPDIRHAVQIAAATDAIYPLVAAGAGFTAWWAEDVTERDGAVELGFFSRRTLYRLRQQAAEPIRRAEWMCETGAEWKDTRLLFTLDPQPNGTLLRFTHAAWASETDYFVSCNTTWGALMLRLKAAAEGKSPGPLFRTDSMAY